MQRGSGGVGASSVSLRESGSADRLTSPVAVWMGRFLPLPCHFSHPPLLALTRVHIGTHPPTLISLQI